MRLVTIGAFTIASILAFATSGFGQQTGGNVENGHRIAEQWCSECHQVGPSSTRDQQEGLSFARVAALPSTTALSLKVFLRTSHKDMPNLHLTEAEANDIIAYILGLKEH